MQVVLLSTYDLGRQPFGLATASAWLERAGHSVHSCDLSVEELPRGPLAGAGLVVVYLPMHTAARAAIERLDEVRRQAPGARWVACGLYAPLAADQLRRLGFTAMLGGEFEAELVRVADALEAGADPGGRVVTSTERLEHPVPRRDGLPPLDRYAGLIDGDERRLVGATEASRGCKHHCRHCPVVPVYGGRFRVVDPSTVLADVDALVAAGAGHITFGDPDFLNGPAHARRVVEGLRRRHPRLTWDATIKVEHLRRHREWLPWLVESGCRFVTTAVESFDDEVLARLDKGHTRRDVVDLAADARVAGLHLHPTFIPFHPWQTPDGYLELLAWLRALEWVPNVAPVQLGLRLLVPAGSRLLELDEVRRLVGPLDPRKLVHPWAHPDPRVDTLQRKVEAIALEAAREGNARPQTFETIWERAAAVADGPAPRPALPRMAAMPRSAVPYLNEPWYC